MTFRGELVLTAATRGEAYERLKEWAARAHSGQLAPELQEEGFVMVFPLRHAARVRLEEDGEQEEVMLTLADEP